MNRKNRWNSNPGQSPFLAVVYIIFGLLLCFFARSFLMTIARLLALAILAYGAWELYCYYHYGKTDNSLMLFGVISLIAGLFIFLRPGALISVLPSAAGVVLIFNAVFQMQKAFAMKSLHVSGWLFSLIFAAVLMIGGIVLFTNPIQSLSYILKIVGIMLAAEGAFMLYQSSLRL